MEWDEAATAYCLQRARLSSDEDAIHLPPGVSFPTKTLKELWEYMNKSQMENTLTKVCSILLIAEASLERIQQIRKISLSDMEKDKHTTRLAFAWVSASILPKKEFADDWEEYQLAGTTEKSAIHEKYRMHRLRSSLGLSVLALLDSIIHLDWLVGPEKVIGVLAAFTAKNDPWTTEATYNRATSLIELYTSRLPTTLQNPLGTVLDDILVHQIKPLFSASGNPDITPAGRKNLYGASPRRSHSDMFSPVSKPWKFNDIYIVTVLNWTVHQYEAQHRTVIEAQCPQVAPAILSLIDDESLAYKALGCELLCTLVQSLRQSGSDLLRRTNLDAVYQHAISPCLHLIPTTTPEDRSIHLLSAAYPALFAVIRARYPDPVNSPPPPSVHLPENKAQKEKAFKDTDLREKCLLDVMRNTIITSYQHISSPRPSEDTSISSYPHPRLSTLLLRQLTIAIDELGIYAGKYLQHIIPLLTPTLANPFGTAYFPLLEAAVSCTKATIMNGWVRIWSWRAEILAGVCGCWLQLGDEVANEEISIVSLRKALREIVRLLRLVITERTDFVAIKQTINFDAECQQLIDGDGKLKDLLLPA